ncbi:MAG: sigma-70 family RNA polymerase sigma factor [Clostridia bacterium]|nr:sigma-70 family RNA polymerase sigma factor [Clostridia bacterium]
MSSDILMGEVNALGEEFICEKNKSFTKNRELIERAQRGDDKATEELIVSNTGLVRSLALRFRDRGLDFEDLMQIGTIGMIKAIRSFDLERGTVFSTYAVPLIIGEIRRYLRDDGIIKVSRSYKKLGVQLLRIKNEIMSTEGRDAHIDELASACGVSSSEAAVALDAITPVSSLSEYIYGEEGMTLESTIADDNSENDMEKLCENVALSQAISKMQPLWKKIVLLRYYRDYTQQQTAELLGLSQVKISREEKKIFAFLREELA